MSEAYLLSEENANLKKALRTLELSLDTLSSEKRTLANENTRLRSELSASATSLREAQENLASLRRENSVLTREIGTLTSRVQDKERQLEEALTSRKAGDVEVTLALANAKSAAALEAKYADERRNLRGRLEAASKAEAKATAALAASEAARSELEAVFGEKVKTLVAKLGEELETAVAEKGKIQVALAELKAASIEAAHERKRIEASKEVEVGLLREELEILRRRASETQSEKVDLVAKSSRELERLALESGSLRGENERLQGELALVNREVAALRAASERLSRVAEERKTDAVRASESLSERERRATLVEGQLRKELEALREELERKTLFSDGEVARYSRELREESERSKNLVGKIGPLNEKLAALETKAQARESALSERAEIAEKEARELRARTAALEVEVRMKNGNKRSSTSDLEAKYQALKEKHADLKQKLAFANRKLKEFLLERKTVDLPYDREEFAAYVDRNFNEANFNETIVAEPLGRIIEAPPGALYGPPIPGTYVAVKLTDEESPEPLNARINELLKNGNELFKI